MEQTGDTPHPEDVLSRERDARAELLARHATSGSMTLAEYARRAASLRRADTAEGLDSAVAGLSALAAEPPTPHKSWLFGIFGGTDQRGRWRLGSKLRVVCILGGAHLDLGAAQPEAPECTITVVALLGGVDIAAPDGIQVILSGLSLLGGRSDERGAGTPLPGAPVVRVRSFALLGGVKVKDPDER